MKLLLTADWHLSDNPRDDYRFGAAQLVGRVAHKKGVSHLVILGDLTEERDHHSAAFTNRVVTLLASIAKINMRVIVLRGNHDASDPSMPFFRFINDIPNLSYVVSPETWRLDNLDIALIPHGCWPDTPPDVDLILTHQTFSGATAENDTSLRGLRLPYRSPPIYSGDVHVPQRQGPVIYVGPPTLIKFGDRYKPRVVLIGEKLQASSIALKTPTKRLVNVTANDEGGILYNNTEINRGDILKVRVTFAPGLLPPMSHVRANIDAMAKDLGASVYSIIPMLDQRTKGPMPVTPVARSDTDLVRQYADTRSFDEPTRAAGLKIVGGQD